MCGITGGLYFKGVVDSELCVNMNNSIRHRGPDDEGYLIINTMDKKLELRSGRDTIESFRKIHNSVEYNFDIKPNLFFGHRRLSILDLSELGHQPMCNEDRSIWLTYNGEVYNYLEIKDELERLGHKFKSKTDSEVIIHAYEEWGYQCLNRFNGMWAFAIYDFNKDILFLSRDRFGVKPLYYYIDNTKIIFASEIKAVLQDKSYIRKENEKVVNRFLVGGVLDDSNETFFKGIYQLEPGNYLVVKDNQIEITRYYDIPNNTAKYDFEQAKQKFFDIFYKSIDLRLRSDVPVGTLLSGGLDSSSIVSMVHHQFKTNNNDNKINTFSSVFSNKIYDEQEYIDEVNDKKNCIANKIEAKPDNLENDIEKLIYIQEEPFVSLSIYAQWNVMKMVSNTGVKVLLDGQGADEILAGYGPYYVPFFVSLIREGKFIKLLREEKAYFKYYNKCESMLRVNLKIFFESLPSSVKNTIRSMIGKNKKNYYTKFNDGLKDELYNSLTYSLRQLLHYEDRNSMAFSIESRVPFLDYTLVEFLFSIDNEYKINNGETKYIMREALKDILPDKIRNRKDKMGFVTPQEVWQKDELKDFIDDVLKSSSFKNRRFYQKLDINNEDFLKVWRYVNLELWMRMFIDKY